MKVAEPSTALAAQRVAADDMDDSQDAPDLPPLRRVLQASETLILGAFKAADAAALSFQTQYRRRALGAAAFGSAAVVIAIIQLIGPEDYSGVLPPSVLVFLEEHPNLSFWLLPVTEGIAAGTALAIVLFGIGTSLKERWLLARFQAEALRLLKFRHVIDPAWWSESDADAKRREDQLGDDVEEIHTTTYSALHGWITRGTTPELHPAPAGPVSEESLQTFLDYYRANRLYFQMKYLSDAVRRGHARDARTRLVGPALFYGSVAFVLAHLVVDVGHVLGPVGPGNEAWSRLLIAVAAALPVLGAGFRVHRAANEFARNASRFEASHHSLFELSKRLRDAREPQVIYRELGFCEQMLEADLREWMRLMMEAEWFG